MTTNTYNEECHVTKTRADMTEHSNGYSGAHVDGRCMDSVGCVPVDDSIQVWIPVVESAWHEHSSSPGCQHHTRWLSLPGPRSGNILNC